MIRREAGCKARSSVTGTARSSIVAAHWSIISQALQRFHEDALLLEALLGRGATPAGICTCGTREGAPLRGRMNDTCFTRDAGLQPDTGVLGIHPHRPSRTCRLHRQKQQVQRVPPPQHFPANGRQSALLALIFPQRTHSIQRLQPRQALPPTARTFSGCSGGR